MPAAPRVAIGGFMLESNCHAPVATEAEFRAAVYAEGEDILADLARPAPRMPATLWGFWKAMNEAGDWVPVPLVMTSAGASGSARGTISTTDEVTLGGGTKALAGTSKPVGRSVAPMLLRFRRETNSTLRPTRRLGMSNLFWSRPRCTSRLT